MRSGGLELVRCPKDGLPLDENHAYIGGCCVIFVDDPQRSEEQQVKHDSLMAAWFAATQEPS